MGGLSVYNLAVVLDKQYCPNLVYCAAHPRQYIQEDQEQQWIKCLTYLNWIFLPWMVGLPLWVSATQCFKSQLVVSLHTLCWSPGLAGGEAAPLVQDRDSLRLPAPEVMYRITPTFYSRVSPDDVLATSASSPRASASVTGSLGSRCPLDVDGSILSARGGVANEIVESEQMCFVCYDSRPDSIFLECGHAGVCRHCAGNLMNRPQRAVCPVCRARITRVVIIRADLPVPSHLDSGQLLHHSTGSCSEEGDGRINGFTRSPRRSPRSTSVAVVVEEFGAVVPVEFVS